MVEPAVARAAAALAPLGGDSALDRARAGLTAAPWRVVLVGRVSAGKSTLVNALAPGAGRRTGLGGVTDVVAEVAVGDAVVVDTPGIDGVQRSLAVLGPPVQAADVVVWVVDGLQPMTRSERDVLEVLLDPDAGLHVVVSRLDLAPDDAEAVLQRVDTLTAPWAPASVRALDLRALARAVAAGEAQAPLDLLDPLPRPPPHRLAPVRAALRAARERLAGPTEAELVAAGERLRAEVRGLATGPLAATEALLSDEGLHAPGARRALAAALREAAATWAPSEPLLGEIGPLPPVHDPSTDAPWGRLTAAMGGRSHARRQIHADAGRWVQEAELVVVEHLAELRAGEVWRQARARDAARAAVDGALAACG